MKIFILEDEIHTFPRKQMLAALSKHELTIATSCDDAKAKYQAGTYDMLLLDHDMRGFFDASTYHNTGYQFCVWMVEQETQTGAKKPAIILHSQNHVGRKNMARFLEDARYTVAEYYFSQSYVDWLTKL
jgi:CheY-like chemotaxis protein